MVQGEKKSGADARDEIKIPSSSILWFYKFFFLLFVLSQVFSPFISLATPSTRLLKPVATTVGTRRVTTNITINRLPLRVLFEIRGPCTAFLLLLFLFRSLPWRNIIFTPTDGGARVFLSETITRACPENSLRSSRTLPYVGPVCIPNTSFLRYPKK